VRYAAPGSPALARRVQELAGPGVECDESWGLDHGTWGVLCRVYPEAAIPVVQLKIDARRPARWHYEMGRRLGALRREGVLLAASGNVVHNLRLYDWGRPGAGAAGWAAAFEERMKQLIRNGADEELIEYERLEDGRKAAPTAEHYLPLLYVLGARDAGEAVEFPVEGIEGGALSMLSVRLG